MLLVPAYQPETAFHVFSRTVHGRDISTGKTHPDGEFHCTKGPLSTWHIKNKIPPPVELRCYILDPLRTCTDVQIKALNEGRAVIKDFVVVDILDERATLDEQGERGITRVGEMQKWLSTAYNALTYLASRSLAIRSIIASTKRICIGLI